MERVLVSIFLGCRDNCFSGSGFSLLLVGASSAFRYFGCAGRPAGCSFNSFGKKVPTRNSCKLSADDAGVWGARTETEILDTSQDAGEIVDAGDAGEGMLGMLEMSRMLVMLGVGDADNDGVAGDAGTMRQPSIFDAFWTHTPKSAQFHAPSPSSQFVGHQLRDSWDILRRPPRPIPPIPQFRQAWSAARAWGSTGASELPARWGPERGCHPPASTADWPQGRRFCLGRKTSFGLRVSKVWLSLRRSSKA